MYDALKETGAPRQHDVRHSINAGLQNGWFSTRGSISMKPASLRTWAKRLRRQTLVVYFAARDPRTPWFVRLLALAVAAYALSPVDLIPDFVPILGLLDDLILIPLGLALVIRLTPADVMASATARALTASGGPASRGVVAVIVAVWILALAWLAWWALRKVRA